MDAGTDAGLQQEDAGTDAGTDAGSPCQGPLDLYVDDACEVVGPEIRAYEPAYTLWTDAAAKERYVYLPAGTQIDTSDPNNWEFPVGTRLYKNFYRGDVRLETRILTKTAAGVGRVAWEMRVWLWDDTGLIATEVTDAPIEERENVLGTTHDIPSGTQCVECHAGVRDSAIGFSAIQLNHSTAGVTLQSLLDDGWLTDPIDTAAAVMPGSGADQEALGYLHANCGHCHHEPPPADPTCLSPACFGGLFMWVDVGTATLEDSSTHQTAVNQLLATFSAPTAPCRIRPGDPDASAVVVRMSDRGSFAQMPPLGTEDPHTMGIETVRTWISGLTATPDVQCDP